jgi:hypothetical protein
LPVAIYADDHFPPHFHLVGRDWRCSVEIETLELMDGRSPRSELREAIAWARANKSMLMAKWSEFNERD